MVLNEIQVLNKQQYVPYLRKLCLCRLCSVLRSIVEYGHVQKNIEWKDE